LFGLEDELVSLVGSPTIPDWVQFRLASGEYDVESFLDKRTVDNPDGRRFFRYQLQGPTAVQIAQRASGRGFEDVRFFQLGELEIAGVPMRFLSHTMTGGQGKGSTGLELIGPFEDREKVLEALVEAGAEFGLRQGGYVVYPTAALESGWIGLHVPAIYSGEAMRPYRESLAADSYEGTVSLAGSFQSSSIEDYYFTPWNLGYHRLIGYDHEFTGREALEKLADRPHRRKVWLRWNDEDVAAAMASSFFDTDTKPARPFGLPQSSYATYQYDAILRGGDVVGVSNKTGYSLNVGSWSSNAVIDEELAREGEEVVVVWGDPTTTGQDGKPAHRQVEIRATVSPTRLA
jgi:glycine cleavage system aminomethyltransferase T